jgi:hypothetical protein
LTDTGVLVFSKEDCTGRVVGTVNPLDSKLLVGAKSVMG